MPYCHPGGVHLSTWRVAGNICREVLVSDHPILLQCLGVDLGRRVRHCAIARAVKTYVGTGRPDKDSLEQNTLHCLKAWQMVGGSGPAEEFGPTGT